MTRNILECSCSQDGYLLSIMALISFKVLGTYAAVIGGSTLSEPRGAESCDNDNDGTHITASFSPDRFTGRSLESQPPSNAVLHGYGFEVEERERLMAQQVMGELHRVQGLVNGLSRRLRGDDDAKQATSKDSVSDAQASPSQVSRLGLPAPFSGILMDQLEIHLRSYLRAVSDQILNVLRQS